MFSQFIIILNGYFHIFLSTIIRNYPYIIILTRVTYDTFPPFKPCGIVLILGNANVGKTCITRILIGKKPKMSRQSTEGIQVHVNRACINKETKKIINFALLTSTVSGIFALSLVIGISCVVPCNCYVLYCAVQQVVLIVSPDSASFHCFL
jgi:hypothetical protein